MEAGVHSNFLLVHSPLEFLTLNQPYKICVKLSKFEDLLHNNIKWQFHLKILTSQIWVQNLKSSCKSFPQSFPFWASWALGVKNSLANAGDIRDTDLIPGLGISPGGGQGHPLQYSCLENPLDRGSWWATVHGVAKSQTQLKRVIIQSFPLRHCVRAYPEETHQ